MGHGNGELTFAKQRETDDRKARAYRSLQKIKKKFLIMSGKGGVGKSSVSLNLSIALADMGHKVGLMDIDIHGPDIPRMMGLKQNLGETIEKRMTPVAFNDNLSVVSVESLLTNKDDAIIWRGGMKHTTIMRFIGDVEWGELDFLIIDCPPGTGDEPLTIAQTIRDAQAIIVTTPQEVSLADIRKSINFCKNTHVDIFGIVENMSGLNCPHCGKPIDLFGSGGGKRIATKSVNRFLGKIPFDAKMVVCGDQGISYQENYSDSEASQVFREIAGKMVKF
jgi:Mrp family chromosome partitioning ATPase